MLLRNYDNLVVGKSLIGYGNLVSFGTDFSDASLKVKSINGYIYDVLNDSDGRRVPPLTYMVHTLSNNAGQSWFVVGAGNSQVTYDDYKLESALSTSQITAISGSWVVSDITYNSEDNSYSRTGSYDFQAKVDLVDDLSIKEIGVITTYGSNDNFRYLVYREILDQPISVLTGQYFKVSLTTTIYANSNKPADYQASVSVE